MRGLSKSYGRTQVLHNLDLQVPWGQTLTVLGPNGSGKTTLIKTLATLAKPDAGDVRIAGLSTRRSGVRIRRAIGVVTHEPLLYDGLTGAENLRFFARMFGLDRIEERIGSVAAQMGVTDRLDARVGTLSHGMRRRFSIARALLHSPSILIMDEPESGLDQQALSLLETLIADGSHPARTILMTTHNLERGIALADRVAILSRGRIAHDGAPDSDATRAAYLPIHLRPAWGGAASMRASILAVLTILWKDIVLELRTKDIVVTALVFALLVIVVFNFAITPTPQTVAFVAPGILWIAFTFGGVLGLNRSMALENESGGLHALMLTPVSRDLIFFGKMLGSSLFMLLVEVAVFPVFAVLYNFSLLLPGLIPIAVLATLGIATVGTLFSAMAVNTRSREVMLPLLFFPVAVPAIIAAVEASTAVIQGSSPFDRWVPFLIAFDALFLVVCPFAFQLIVEE